MTRPVAQRALPAFARRARAAALQLTAAPRLTAALPAAAALRLTAALPAAAALGLVACGNASWDGVDEAVIRRVAEDAGRHDTGPLFAGFEGDLLLFAFLWAGLLSGFALGYFSRVLFVERAGQPAGEPGGKPGVEGLRAD